MENHASKRQCRMLCIQGTGTGKSLLYQTLSAHFAQVTIYISPLLTLASDQVNKLFAKTQFLGSTVVPIHLDAVPISGDHMKNLIRLLNGAKNAMSIVVFTSPQTLTDKFPSFVGSVKNRISFVVVDELHMYNAFGRSFREEFVKLKNKLFSRLDEKIPMLFVTASCNEHIKASFQSMIGVSVTHTHWPSAVEMANRRVSLFCTYSSKPLKRVLSAIENTVLDTADGAGAVAMCVMTCVMLWVVPWVVPWVQWLLLVLV